MKISEEEIEKEALANSVRVFQVKDPRQYGEYSHERFIEGATWAQNKILETARENFNSWYTCTSDIEILLNNVGPRKYSMQELVKAWEAAKLSSAKEIEKLNKAFDDVNEQNTFHADRMVELQKERDELVEALLEVHKDKNGPFWETNKHYKLIKKLKQEKIKK